MNVQLQRALENLFNRYIWAVHLVLIAFAAFFLARIVNVFVYRSIRELPSLESTSRPNPNRLAALTPTASSPQANVRQILDRNLMQARREDVAPKVEEQPAFDPGRVQACTLGANIVGIVSANRAEWSYVIYRDPKTQDVTMVSPLEGRNEIAPDILLLEISPGEAKFKKENHTEVCVVGDEGKAPPTVAQTEVSTTSEDTGSASAEGGVSKVSENEYAIEQKKLQWVQEHLNEVATDARIVPAFREGKADGFKLFSIRPGSVYQQIGLQNGDVIQKINGYDMNSPDKALEVYQKLRDAKSINVQLERRGTPKTLNYQIR